MSSPRASWTMSVAFMPECPTPHRCAQGSSYCPGFIASSQAGIERPGRMSCLSRRFGRKMCGSMRRADGFRGADGLEVAQGVGGAEVAPELLDALLRHALAQREPAAVMGPARGDEGAGGLGGLRGGGPGGGA